MYLLAFVGTGIKEHSTETCGGASSTKKVASAIEILLIVEIKMSLPDIVGLLGAVFYLSAYALIQLRIYTVDDAIITVLNILGGVALIYSLSWNFNLGSITTQVAWLVFTVVGYVRFRMMARRRAAVIPAE